MDVFRSADGVGVGGLFAAGCDEYDDVPPRSSGGSYDLLPIVGESASAEELETWREIRSEYESAVGN
ncbi:MAG: hypothetical protein V8Q54_10475 [Alistipes senegalensis]